MDYAGGGIGEYQYYDRQAQQWDDSTCVAAANDDGNGSSSSSSSSSSRRCAKMDCHLPDTNFKLLGFFKEPNYHEWMEQLFKHQGVCLWTDAEYNFMQTDRYLWPCSCTSTGQQDEDGNTLYYDTKPMPEGRIGLGLYTDNRCKYDYTGTERDITQVLQNIVNNQDNNNNNNNNNNNDYGTIADLESSLAQWNDAFDVYKICQPCKAYDLGYNPDIKQGNRQGEDDDAGYQFDCYDDADYINVNQCMKFKTKTEMLAADFRDIMLAHQQGNIVEFEVMGQTYGYGGYRGQAELLTTFNMAGSASGMKPRTMVLFGLSFVVLVAGLVSFGVARRNARNLLASKLKTPLIAGGSSSSTSSLSVVLT